MNLTPEHLRASYEIYMKYGNSSSATVFSVLNKLRESEGKEKVVACAFGPGIALEMMILRRHRTRPASTNGSESDESFEILETPGAAVKDNLTDGNGVPYLNGDPITTNRGATDDERSDTDSPAAQAGSSVADKFEHKDTPAANRNRGPASNLPVEDVD